MGVIGSAWATTVSRWLMAVDAARARLANAEAVRRATSRRICSICSPLWRMLKLGLPIGAQMMLEGGAFNVMALLMGWLGVAQVAAHQIALNLASLTFMVPLGVSSAAAVIVGHAVGRGDAEGVRRSTRRVADRRRRVHAVHGRAVHSSRPSRSRASTRAMRRCSRSRRCCCRSPACSRYSTACRSSRSACCAGSAIRACR